MGEVLQTSSAAPTRTCVLGGAGTGKTEFIARRAAQVVKADAGASVLVLAASPEAARTLSARIADLVDENEDLQAGHVRVMTPRALELELLGSEAAQAATGRRARLLLPFEENILLEDVKACGVRPRRLREMLKFFYRGWTELADDDPTWLVSDEEIKAHALIKECLTFSGGILEPELANLAVHWLRANGEARRAAGADHVLVDDYPLLSRASQVLAGMLAGKTLTVAGDTCAASEVLESYPHAAGLETFARETGVEIVRLEACFHSQAVARACDALRAEAYDGSAPCPCIQDAPEGFVETHEAASPEEEIAFVVERVRDTVKAGCAPQDVYVAVPNGTWAKGVAEGLRRAGIASARRASGRVLGGDVRDLGRCRAARTFTLLALASDEHDALAWRSWCGFGDWLAENPGFAALRRLAGPHGMGAYEVLEALAAGKLPAGFIDGLDTDERLGVGRIGRAFAEGRAALEALRGLEGAELVDAAWARTAADDNDAPAVPDALADVIGVGRAGVAQSARGLVGHALEQLALPRFRGAGNGPAVPIGDLASVHGLEPRLLVLSGFVDGFIPKHAYFDLTKTPLDRLPALHAADVRRVYQAVGKAQDGVLVTSFTGIEALRAEKLDLKVERVFMRDGVRRARIAPSELIAALGLPTKAEA